jgi:hypothetical protein
LTETSKASGVTVTRATWPSINSRFVNELAGPVRHTRKLPADAVTNEIFDLRSRHPGDAAGFGLAILQQRLRDIAAESDETVVALSIRRPKKRGPFQFVSVMARAMVERLA